MTVGIYNSATLMEMTRQIKSITPFWLSFFPRQINFTTEEIYWDKVDHDYRRLAPLVVPNVQGRPGTLPGYTGVSFRPAYVKVKHALDPNTVMERQAGEGLVGGSMMSPEQRRQATLAWILQNHKTSLINRNEWLAARAYIDGAVTLSGEDYPTTTVNFQRHASLTYTLTGTARWSQTTATPLADIMAGRVNSNNRSGSRIKRLVFGGTAWSYFSGHPNVPLYGAGGLLDKNIGGTNADVQRMWDGYEGQEFMGYLSGSQGGGRLELWVDTSKYVDESGNEQFFLDQKAVVGVSDAEGVRCFGAIKDFRANLQPLEFFQKMWQNEDPSAEFVLTQSAPLMVPRKPNATFKIITSD